MVSVFQQLFLLSCHINRSVSAVIRPSRLGGGAQTRRSNTYCIIILYYKRTLFCPNSAPCRSNMLAPLDLPPHDPLFRSGQPQHPHPLLQVLTTGRVRTRRQTRLAPHGRGPQIPCTLGVSQRGYWTFKTH